MARAKAVPIPWFIRATCVVTAWFWFGVRTGPAPWRGKTVQWPPPRENDPPDRFLTLVDQVRTPAHACLGRAERPPQAPLGPESRRAAPPGRAREKGLTAAPPGPRSPFTPPGRARLRRCQQKIGGGTWCHKAPQSGVAAPSRGRALPCVGGRKLGEPRPAAY